MLSETVGFSSTREILGIDWEKKLPVFWGDYWLARSSFDEFSSLKASPDSFLVTSDSSQDRFLKDGASKAKEAYLRSFGDFFTFRHREEVIGVALCELLDWSTYYLRYITVHQDHRHQGLTLKFVAAVEEVMAKTEVDKITCEISPSNLGQVVRMGQAGYVCTGNHLSERFGALLRYTKYLKEDSRKAFSENFTQRYYQPPRENLPGHQRSDA